MTSIPGTAARGRAQAPEFSGAQGVVWRAVVGA
jgi:hypothetical protein